MSLPLGGTATRAIGLDFGVVMTVAMARGADTALLAEVLPAVERAIVVGGDAGED